MTHLFGPHLLRIVQHAFNKSMLYRCRITLILNVMAIAHLGCYIY